MSQILKKPTTTHTAEESKFLLKFTDVVKVITKRKERLKIYKDREIEKEDSIEEIEQKTQKLAEIIARAHHLVCYTGAGISTSAKIPDYRGTNGVWTLLQQGKELEEYDLSLAEPTFTHMALYELYQRKMLRYVISQNCDGLHLRSGLPRHCLSEIHGNMYIEVCKSCKKDSEYWRLFDTTEKTARYNHKTNRRCHLCGKPLFDSIVHFGERGSLKWPLNWPGACQASEKADVILCIGSSLKVLKKYPWLWQPDRPTKKRAKLCIVNLQWTPKDKLASLKINGKCDDVMQLVMKHLNIKVQNYSKKIDPIFAHASLLSTEEFHTVSQPMLKTHAEHDGKELILGRGPLIRTPTKGKKMLKTNLNYKLKLNDFSDSDDKNKENLEDSSSNDTSILPNKNYYQNFVEYYRCMNGKLPNWYDSDYAYSGLHSIVLPPPPEINFWSSQVVPVFKMNRKAAECEFCFDTYAEFSCQFYKKWSVDFQVKKEKVCECCDISAVEDDLICEEVPLPDTPSDGKNSDDSDPASVNKIVKISSIKKTTVVQPGWYGKGYKKGFQKIQCIRKRGRPRKIVE